MRPTFVRRFLLTSLLLWGAAIVPSLAIAQTVSVPPAVRLGAGALRTFKYPEPVLLKYDVEGHADGYNYTGSAELRWEHDGKSYISSLFVKKFGFNLQSWTSKGTLGPDGLEPIRFGSKRVASSEVSASFARDKNLIFFSPNNPQAILEPGAQDQLSIYLQLCSLLAGESSRWPAGKSLVFQAVGEKSSETWSFVSSGLITADLPRNSTTAIRMTKEVSAERDQKIELWFAPDRSYLPVQIRISKPSGDYLNLLWTESSKP